MSAGDPVLSLLAGQGDPSQQQQQPQGQPQQGQPQQPANNAQNAGPVKAGLRGVLARMLGNFSYGAGQSMLKAAGDETDAERATRLAQTAHLNAQTQLVQAQAKLTPIQLANGATVYAPAAIAGQYFKQQLANQGKVDVAQIGVDGPTLTPEQAQAMGHPEMAGQGLNKALAGIIQNQAGKMPITQDMLSRYPSLPPESLGKLVKISDVLSAERLQMQGTRTTTGGTWKETSPGEWTFLPTSSTTVRGAPSAGNAAPQAPGSPSTPTLPGASNVPPRLKHFMGGGPIYAFDPKTNETVLTTPAEQAVKGYTNPRKTTAPEIQLDTQLGNRLADVATKVTRYDNFMKSADISQADRDMISGVLSSDKFQLGAHGFGAGVEIPVDRLNQALDAANVKGMSPAARDALLGYLNARESIQGYQRVLAGSAKSSDTGLGLNLATLPSPVMPNEFIHNGVSQFGENVKLANRGIPRMPGMPTATDILSQQSPGGGAPQVRIKLTDGRTGTIPASSLPKYQKLGATVIQ